MRPLSALALVVVVAAGAFLAGWHAHRPAPPAAAAGRRILYYHDPMHPAYRSDKPGVAPDCGMALEPVYEGEEPAAGPWASGTVQLSEARQQLIGLRTSEVRKTSESRTLRLLGRVAMEDRRLYRINSATDGWIREVGNQSAGTAVKKNERLGSFYSPEFLSAEQAFNYAMEALDRFTSDAKQQGSQIALTKANVQTAVDTLKNLGMGDPQLEELKRERTVSQDIGIYAPADGIVVARNVFPGQRFDRGLELYRIADLSHVWVLADVFENDAQYIHAGAPVTVHYRDRELRGATSGALPMFDAATRTLKVRLDIDNPGYLLWPDMFVDVDVAVRIPPAIAGPVEAVLDSGIRKTVFVDRGNGYFEARAVETGWRFGEQVEVVRGLTPGERIVVSGNFLIDSETRMKPPLAGARAAKDPVCGMDLDARTAAGISEFESQTYYFCSTQCKGKFDAKPAPYAEAANRVAASAAAKR